MIRVPGDPSAKPGGRFPGGEMLFHCFRLFIPSSGDHGGGMWFFNRDARHALACSTAMIACLLPRMNADPISAFDPAKLNEINATIEKAIADQRMPGAVFLLERKGQSYSVALGRRALLPTEESITADTIFDAASLTKVVATTPSILLLAQRGQIDLDAAVAEYIPEFSGEGKDWVTVRQLLTHTSGLRPGLSLNPPWSGHARAIELAAGEKLQSAPGEVLRYSDINFILLGELVRRAGGAGVEEFARREIYEPLGMFDTRFMPGEELWPRVAPTQQTRDGMLRGVVHDPTARAMGGVAGHAGLFTTARDLARYARMLLNEGELDGVRLFDPETVEKMRSVQTPEKVNARRGLGWDIDSQFSRPRGSLFPLGSFGHTGWTGTCIWIDPFSESFWLLLSNRVHPDGQGNVLQLQRDLGTLAAEAIRGFDFSDVPGALPPRENADAEE
jgi:CubicO group peptidase (beta-lactamase class C family)